MKLIVVSGDSLVSIDSEETSLCLRRVARLRVADFNNFLSHLSAGGWGKKKDRPYIRARHD